MRFGVDTREPIATALRRIGRDETQAALILARDDGLLSPSAVHELRKRVKRIRALLALLHDSATRELRRSRRELRVACLPLSALRDVDVMRATIGTLSRRSPRMLRPTVRLEVTLRLARVRRVLLQSCLDAGVSGQVIEVLQDVSRQLASWQGTGRGFAVCRPGLIRSHRRCRKALQRLERRGRDEDYHEWRKRITALRNQLMMLRVARAPVRTDILALDAAMTALGDDHNLVVFRDAVTRWVSDGSLTLDPRRVVTSIARYQKTLREAALRQAGPICRQRSGDYARSIEAAWSADRRRPVQRRAVR